MNIYGKYGVPNLLNLFRRSHENEMLLKGGGEREGWEQVSVEPSNPL